MTEKTHTSTPHTERSLARWVDRIRGNKIRFTFTEGPTKGHSYDHAFHDDDTVEWHDTSSAKHEAQKSSGSDAGAEAPTEYGTFQVTDDVEVVSYLSSSGYALTVVLNFETGELVGFASNDKSWYPVQGTFEVVRGDA